jgi:hypothetical protein
MKKFTKDTVDLLGALLHDSTIRVCDLPTELNDRKITLRIIRPYWEQPLIKKTLIGKVIKYKNIESKIELIGLYNYNLNWRDDAFNSPDQILTILEIRQRNKGLDIVTEYLDIKVDFADETEVKFYDTSEPTEQFGTTDFGNHFDYKGWEKEYEIKNAAANRVDGREP